jgi:hypothetical protein
MGSPFAYFTLDPSTRAPTLAGLSLRIPPPRAHPRGSTSGMQRDCNGCGKSPTQPTGKHGPTRTFRGLRSAKIHRLIPHARPGSEIAALRRRHRADRWQFLGLPGISRYPPLPAVFRERQSRRDGRSMGFKLVCFQRRNLAHRAAGLRMVKRVMDAYGPRQQREKSGIEKHSQTRSAYTSRAPTLQQVAEKRFGMLREPQHERKILRDFKTPPFVLSTVEGLRESFSATC